MEANDILLFPEFNNVDFDFNSLLDNPNYQTVCGLNVRIDKIMRDLTGTTVVAVSGTMNMRGVRVRGVWDMFGNIIEGKKMVSFFCPKSFVTSVDNLFKGTTQAMMQLVNVQSLEKK